jgi:hypothetical protein
MGGEPQAGWYADPAADGAGRERWWDGSTWTHDVREASAPDFEAPPTPVEPVAAEPVALEPIALDPVAPEPVAPAAVVREPVAPAAVVPEPVVHAPIAPEPVAPAPVAPEPIGVELIDLASVAPERYATQPVAPAPEHGTSNADNPYGSRAFWWTIAAILVNILFVPSILAILNGRKAQRYADETGIQAGREYGRVAVWVGTIFLALGALTLIASIVVAAIAVPTFLAQQNRASDAVADAARAQAETSIAQELTLQGAAVESVDCDAAAGTAVEGDSYSCIANLLDGTTLPVAVEVLPGGSLQMSVG